MWTRILAHLSNSCIASSRRRGRLLGDSARLTWVGAALGLLFLTGCASSDRTQKDPPLPPRFFLEREHTPDRRAREVVLPVSGSRVQIDTIPVLVETDFVRADLMQVDLGLCVRFALRRTSGRALYQMSLQHRGSRLVLVLAGEPVGVRVIDAIFDDGYLFTFLEVPPEALPGLVERMQAAIDAANR